MPGPTESTSKPERRRPVRPIRYGTASPDGTPPTLPGPAREAPPPPEPPGGSGYRFDPDDTGRRLAEAPPPAPWSEDDPKPAPSRRQAAAGRLRRLPVGPLVVGLILVAVAVAVLLDLSMDLPWTALLEVLLVVVGLLLVVAARYRAATRSLLALAVVLAVLLTSAWWAGAGFEGRPGLRTVEPATVEELDTYRLAAGSLTVDLSAIVPSPLGTPVRARVGVGRLVVIVPPGPTVGGTVRTGVGRAETLVTDELGIGNELSAGTAVAGAPRFTLDLSVGIGDLEVRVAE